MLLGAIEGGGTKMICAVGEEDGRIIDKVTIPSGTPDDTMPAIIDYFVSNPVCALGVGCFGPLDLDKQSRTYGYITSTTKVAWQNYDILGVLKSSLKIPCGFDTDVNAAALGEVTYGGMRGIKNGVYITVGTGIGTGMYLNGALLHGMLHPEGGHIPVRPHRDDTFEGYCPFHKNCLEGMASGPAIEMRVGKKAELLAPDDPVWEFESYYIAQAICSYVLTVSPEKVVLGGGVMKQPQLLNMIRTKVVDMLGGYIKAKRIANISDYIIASPLCGDQAIKGCMKLAFDAACAS